MPTVNLYVPPALKARMAAAGKDINWSAIAQMAFENVLRGDTTIIDAQQLAREARSLSKALDGIARRLRHLGSSGPGDV